MKDEKKELVCLVLAGIAGIMAGGLISGFGGVGVSNHGVAVGWPWIVFGIPFVIIIAELFYRLFRDG